MDAETCNVLLRCAFKDTRADRVRKVSESDNVAIYEVDWHKAEVRHYGGAGFGFTGCEDECAVSELLLPAESQLAGWKFYAAMPTRDSIRVIFRKEASNALP